MAEPVVRVEGLGKRYRLGLGPGRRTFREVLGGLPERLLGWSGPAATELWALQDVSFSIQRGEVVGVIGANGAGKSTLLKLLARITRPTRGYLEVEGRVGSLLEVGTGFHSELSGRENVFLSGVILGMRRRDVAARFDRIVEFSGLDPVFLDQPVKRLSSGMQMRLAFSVAAHLEPDVLVVDEVLAVGDVEFQRRCLGRMGEIAGSGRTVLFVSHNMAAVKSLCTRCLVLRQGRLLLDGSTEQAIGSYLELTLSPQGRLELEVGPFSLRAWEFLGPDGGALLPLRPATLSVRMVARQDLDRPSVLAQVMTTEGALLFAVNTKDWVEAGRVAAGEAWCVRFRLESLPLMPGQYRLRVLLRNRVLAESHEVPALLPIEVGEAPVLGGGLHSPDVIRTWYGPIAVPVQVEVNQA